jgi:prepilin peptidase CpaA
MQWGLSWILVAMLAGALALAALGDWRSRRIPNWLNAAIALLAIPFWWATGLSFVPDIAIQIATAAVVFGLFAVAFSLGAMGGGDVKLVAALTLWLRAFAVLKLLVIMSIAGGFLTLAMLIRRRLATDKGELEIPYGIAIAFGGFWLISERFLNHFG